MPKVNRNSRGPTADNPYTSPPVPRVVQIASGSTLVGIGLVGSFWGSESRFKRRRRVTDGSERARQRQQGEADGEIAGRGMPDRLRFGVGGPALLFFVPNVENVGPKKAGYAKGGKTSA